jgi:quinoprotein glucose dehydrogenase
MKEQGFCYVFDRVTGKPIWPIGERPVPQSTVPGERPSPDAALSDQARSLRPAGFTENDVIDFTLELRKQALAILEK